MAQLVYVIVFMVDLAHIVEDVATGMTDQVAALFAKYRATPIVYLGSELFGCTLVYGWARDFNEEIRGPRQTICSVQVEGLSQ